MGQFAIFGGFKSLIVIDISKQRPFPEILKSPFRSTYSLQVCDYEGSNVYLSLGGNDPEYSSDTSDFLNVTWLYNGYRDINKVFAKMNHAHALLEEKDAIINALNLKINELESSLQKESNQNKSTINH